MSKAEVTWCRCPWRGELERPSRAPPTQRPPPAAASSGAAWHGARGWRRSASARAPLLARGSPPSVGGTPRPPRGHWSARGIATRAVIHVDQLEGELRVELDHIFPDLVAALMELLHVGPELPEAHRVRRLLNLDEVVDRFRRLERGQHEGHGLDDTVGTDPPEGSRSNSRDLTLARNFWPSASALNAFKDVVILAGQRGGEAERFEKGGLPGQGLPTRNRPGPFHVA